MRVMEIKVENSDESLMERICNGDHQAFALLSERYADMFFAAAYRMCGHREEAEDIVQEAFLKLWRRPEVFDPSRGVKLSTWLYKVVTNLAIDRMRKMKGKVQDDNVLTNFADSRSGADENLIISEEQAALEEAIAELPERQRVALNLCFYEGLSNKEAAEILEVGVKGLESLLMRAKANLKEKLAVVSQTGSKEKYG